jgi:chromosome segregation ATPase
MTIQSYAHQTIAWVKQRLDDADAILDEIEKSAADVKADARKQADAARARITESRAKLQQYYDELRAQADTVKQEAGELQDKLEAEWIEVESALQAFVASTSDQVKTVRGIVAARARAQRQVWENSLNDWRDQAADAVEKARGELDAAFARLSTEAEKFQARIGEVKDAGDESWHAVKQGFADAKAAHDVTVQKIKDAFSKVL